MTKRYYKEAETTRTTQSDRKYVLNAETRIILSENVQNHQETRTKKPLSKVIGAITVMKMIKRLKTKRVSWLMYLARNQSDAEAKAVQIILTRIDNDIYSIVDACSNVCEMWKEIKWLKQGESINVQDLETNLYWEFRKLTSRDVESLVSYYSRANPDNTPRINRGTGYDNQRVVNVAWARENVEQADWMDDTDDEPEDQELEAHYLYMAHIQEVTPYAADNSGPIFDTKPLQKEQGDTNITIDSLDMSTNGETIDQDDDDLAKERDLLASLIEKLKSLCNPKGGKITDKGTIKTGELDFKNVYFVKEFKFNLFSVSQMCNKKNSVLFNDTECVVLSPDFKLPDENHILLRVHRKNNMYSVDLKNIIPKGDQIADKGMKGRFALENHCVSGSNPLLSGPRVQRLGASRILKFKCKSKPKNPVVASTQSNGNAGTKDNNNVGQARKEKKPGKDYILLPLWNADPPFPQEPKSSQDTGFKPSNDVGKKVNEVPRQENECKDQEEKDNVNSTNIVNAVSLNVNATSNELNTVGRKLSIELPNDPNMPELEDISIFKDSNEDVFGAEADLNNLESTFKKIEEEVYVYQPLGFEDPNFPDRVYKVEKALYGLNQAPRAWYETLPTYLLDNGFQRGKNDTNLFIRRHKAKKSVSLVMEMLLEKELEFMLMTQRHKLMLLGKLKTAKVNAVQVYSNILGTQLDGLPTHKEKYDVSFHTKKVFANIKRIGGGDSLVKATTTAFSLEVEQDSGNIAKTQTKATSNEPSSQRATSSDGPRRQDTMRDTFAYTRYERVPKMSSDSLLARVNTPQSDEDSLKHIELMKICATLQKKVLDLEDELKRTKTTQQSKIDSLERVISSFDDKALDKEDTSKQGRINEIDVDEDIALVSTHDDELQDEGIEDVKEEEVVKVVTTAKLLIDTVVDAAQVTTAIADVPVSAAETIITTALTIIAKSTKTNVEVQDKGKGKAKLIEEPVMPKKRKHQISDDKELAKNLQAEMQAKINEKDRLARERAQKEQEANDALINTWDDIQARIDAYDQLA
nr:reverse transcriptase [Tanacetum cinerariifolium]